MKKFRKLEKILLRIAACIYSAKPIKQNGKVVWIKKEK